MNTESSSSVLLGVLGKMSCVKSWLRVSLVTGAFGFHFIIPLKNGLCKTTECYQ